MGRGKGSGEEGKANHNQPHNTHNNNHNHNNTHNSQQQQQINSYPKFGTPFKKGGRYFEYRNSGLQQQFVLYSRPTLDADATVLLDPNALSDDGTVALRDASFSDDGSLMAYQLSSGGSDWARIKVLRVKEEDGSAEHLDDELELVKFSCLAWTKDGLGFFYNR